MTLVNIFVTTTQVVFDHLATNGDIEGGFSLGGPGHPDIGDLGGEFRI